MTSPMTADRALLRLCGGVRREDWSEPELGTLCDRDWARIAQQATHHGLAGLVSRNLDWLPNPALVPAETVDQLALRRRQVLSQNLARRAAAREMADALAAEQIPLIVLKGVALAQEVYGDLSLRAFNDFDVMVPMESVEAACQVARGLGYAFVRFSHARDWLRVGAHAAGMTRRDGRSVDIHWSIGPGLPANSPAIIWENTVAAPEGSLPGLRLSPAMTVVHMAKHFHTGQYCLLRPLVDFLFAARAGAPIDEADVRRLSLAFNLLSVVEITAVVAERALGTPMGIRLREGGPGLQARTAARLLTDEMLVDAEGRSRIANWLRFLAASGGAAFAGGELLRGLFPPPLALAIFFNAPYHPGMYPTYYWRQLVKVMTLSSK